MHLDIQIDIWPDTLFKIRSDTEFFIRPEANLTKTKYPGGIVTLYPTKNI